MALQIHLLCLVQHRQQMATRGQYRNGEVGNAAALQETRALVDTLTQNRDPKFQVRLENTRTRSLASRQSCFQGMWCLVFRWHLLRLETLSAAAEDDLR